MHGKRVDIDLGVIESENGLVRDYIEKPSLRYRSAWASTSTTSARSAYLRRGAVPVPRPRAPAAGGRRARRRLPERRRLVRHRDRGRVRARRRRRRAQSRRSTVSTRCRPPSTTCSGDGRRGSRRGDEAARRLALSRGRAPAASGASRPLGALACVASHGGPDRSADPPGSHTGRDRLRTRSSSSPGGSTRSRRDDGER